MDNPPHIICCYGAETGNWDSTTGIPALFAGASVLMYGCLLAVFILKPLPLRARTWLGKITYPFEYVAWVSVVIVAVLAIPMILICGIPPAIQCRLPQRIKEGARDV